MRPRMMGLALLASLLVAAAPASAIYIVTPLTLTASDTALEAGETIDLTIAPQNESTAADWRGKLVRLSYAYDTAESSGGPEEPTSDETYRTVPIDDAFALDDDARGAFTWTAPAETDDRNVQLRVESADGELLAVVDVAVGDAPPVMRILAGSGEPAPTEPGPREGAEQPPGDPQDDVRQENDVPAAGIVATLALVGIAALALRRR